MMLTRSLLSIALALILSGCASFASTNIKLSDSSAIKTKATFSIEHDRGSHKKTLVILALSGGGSRAAYWSASIMLALETVFGDELNILEEVDAISAVSGGSLPAAYYAISRHPEEAGIQKYLTDRYWDASTVKDLMSINYEKKWFANWFWPTNIAKFWFTAYDRTDIMAQTFADNLFDSKMLVRDYRIEDIKPTRPYLILNSTNGTSGDCFGTVFSFTHEDFKEKLCSDINDYEIARAVMASATFPALFNSMTLRDYRNECEWKENGTDECKCRRAGNDCYMHVFDGGNVDNLGLISAHKVIKKNIDKYERLIVILVDAYVAREGISNKSHDPREFFDYIIDFNFFDSVNSLLKKNRDDLLWDPKFNMEKYNKPNYIFYHIEFNDVDDYELRKDLNSIKTRFKLNDRDKKNIDKAVRRLMTKNNECLKQIRDILTKDDANVKNSYCFFRQ